VWLLSGGLYHIYLMDETVFILLGTNLGDRLENLANARLSIERFPSKIIRASGIYETAAWGNTEQENFYNQVIEIQSKLRPIQLLNKIHETESNLGRIRKEKWGPRSIDIDILFYGDDVVSESSLIIPHPGIPSRRFTLIPLNEIAPKFIHPVLKKKIGTLLQECSDHLEVTKLCD
jgi:2-amino-4-hydroxy-6-hydroxymethyldihydropteridine diphosphokinase